MLTCTICLVHIVISNIMHNVLMTIKIDTCNALAKAERPKPEILNSLVLAQT